MKGCQICLYAVKHRQTEYFECRKSPPTPAPHSGGYLAQFAVWPTVLKDDWCGEFKSTQRPEPFGYPIK